MSTVSLIVALVGPLPPPAGGMANQTLQLAELLAQEGVTVRTIRTQSPYRPAWIGGIPVVRALSRLLPYLFSLWRGCRGVQVVHIMANSGWSWHLFAAPAVWIGRLRGAGVVLNYRGGEAEAFFDKAFQWVRPTLALVHAVVVPSGFLSKVFYGRGMVCRVIPNIINLERFKRPTIGDQNGESLRLLVARNLEKLYDNETVIRAYKIIRNKVPQATLVIAGAGPERDRLIRLTEDLGVADGVRFVGQIENKGMPALMQEADVMLNPSLADNMPISLLEAFACGLPVVSTNVGGVPFLVTHEETGLLIAPRAPAEMAAAVLRLHGDNRLRERLTRAARAQVEHYTWPEIWPQIAQVYDSVMQRPRASRSNLSG